MSLPHIGDDEIIDLARRLVPVVASLVRGREARLRDALYYAAGYLRLRATGRPHASAVAELLPVAAAGATFPPTWPSGGLPHVGDVEIIDVAQLVLNVYTAYFLGMTDEELARDGTYYLRHYVAALLRGAAHAAALRAIERDMARDHGRPDPYPEEPGPTPGPGPGTPPAPGTGTAARPLEGRIRPFGPRGITDDRGPFLATTISRFYLMRAYAEDRDRVRRELDADAALNYHPRVFAEVGTLDRSGFWDQAGFSPNDPRLEATIAGITREAAARSHRVLWTLIGKSIETATHAARLAFVRRCGAVLRDVADGVLAVEMINEAAAAWSGPSPDELLELVAAFDEASGGLFLVGSSAVWTERGWNADPIADYEGATAMSPGGWSRTQVRGGVRALGIAHLDRDMDRGELVDRPWRQAWDIGLEGDRWADNEATGPGASVRSENRAAVLRSHRLVSHVSRAAIACLHGEPGVRGLRPWTDEPAYFEAWKSRRVIDPAAVNGSQHNARAVYPERPWTLPVEYVRSENGNRAGVVRCYSLRGPDGVYWSVPFGPVSAFALEAARDLHVECYQQDGGTAPIWTRQVARGERVTFEPTAVDWLIRAWE